MLDWTVSRERGVGARVMLVPIETVAQQVGQRKRHMSRADLMVKKEVEEDDNMSNNGGNTHLYNE